MNSISYKLKAKSFHAFSIIELMVTISIMGLLVISIVPAIGRIGRNNNVSLAAQSVREALADAHTYAIAPDPTICAAATPVQINRYSFFAPSANGVTTPASSLTYQCGNYTTPQSLQINQYALLAEYYDTQVQPARLYVRGIVRISALDPDTQFTSPIRSLANKSTWVGFSVPSGSFSITPTDPTFATYNHHGSGQNNEVYGPPGRYWDTSTLGFNYVIAGVGNSDGVVIPIFINMITGQVTSTSGSAPEGFYCYTLPARTPC